MKNLHGSQGSINLNFGREEWKQSDLTVNNAQACIRLNGIQQRTSKTIDNRGRESRRGCKGMLASRLNYPLY
jgi:hypothetical protein